MRKFDEKIVEPFPNPEDLMPLPDRLKKPESLDEAERASVAKDVSVDGKARQVALIKDVLARKRAKQRKQ